MNRSSFIRNLIGTFGLSVVPLHLIKQYQKIYLLQCFVRGFRFYDGETMLNAMKEGDMLELVREPDNTYDNCAIALYYNRQKIGFVPAESNEVLSRLMDAKVVELQAEITHLEKKAQAWENVHIAVYVLKDNVDTIHPNQPYLTQLETPHYHSLKYNNNTYGRVYYDDEDDENVYSPYTADDFYQDMVDNSANDGVYDLLHNEIDVETLSDAVDNNLFITQLNKLPNKFKSGNLLQTLDGAVINLDNFFNDEGLVMLNVEKLAKIPSSIKSFVHTIDKTGNKFVEVVFNAIA
ncbi:MAG: hypothetical protein EAY66_07495 [Sphingobacteriales bacterium]|nr:MAG: hypothetical protein EAY66_07495 [Sphingobacteriales bacterium]